MSLVNPQFSSSGRFEDAVMMDGQITEKELLAKDAPEKSNYVPEEEERLMRERVVKDLRKGITNIWTPRVEFNDLSTLQRFQVDQMSWNTYQPNNGQGMSADDIQGWRSNAMRPIVRNKCVSIAAHATARLIFPKVFANNQDSDEDTDAAEVMEDLMELAADESNYRMFALRRTIAAMFEPVSIGYTEYGEVYSRVKKQKVDGKWQWSVQLNDTFSGFQDVAVTTEQLYIENFYEPDIQKQGFLIWRRVISYTQAKAKYGAIYPNFDKYVREGVQCVYSDANASFYWVYDPNMRQYEVEEIIYWNKSLDVKIIMVNGVILTDCDNPNPRNDKLYPFDKFGYELINNNCFYYKSLAFKLQSDAAIINTLYPMIIDGTYLKIFAPMVATGSEVIGSEVIVPGQVTTLSAPDANLRAIQTSVTNMQEAIGTLEKVEESLDDTSQSKVQAGQAQGQTQTAYEISRIEQNASTILGLFVQMIAQHVKDFGKLRLGDIIQYETIADVSDLEGAELTYKTFLVRNKMSNGGTKTRKITFDANLPNKMSPDEHMDASLQVAKEQGGLDSKTELYKVNPELFRNLKYMVTVSPDVLNPKSEDLNRAYHLETYDRMVMNQGADPEETLRLLLSTDPQTKRDPDKYVAQQPQQQPPMPGQPGQPPVPGQAQPNQPMKPKPSTSSGLPNQMAQPPVG